MPSEALIAYPHLPPTTNILDSQQRTRLMRSTRKIGTVLGTMPYLVENDTSFTMLPLGQTTSKALKRHGSIFTHHQRSSSSIASSSTSTILSHRLFPSTSSITLPQSVAPGSQNTESPPINPPGLSTTRKPRSGGKAPQLYLQLDLVSISPTDDRVVSPLSPCTPLTPPVPDAAEARRKRMAKLARHLGENIPVELVFAAESAPKPATVPSGRLPGGRSLSVHVTHTEPACIGSNRPFAEQSKQGWVGEWNRSNISDVQKELRKLRVG